MILFPYFWWKFYALIVGSFNLPRLLREETSFQIIIHVTRKRSKRGAIERELETRGTDKQTFAIEHIPRKDSPLFPVHFNVPDGNFTF